MTLKILHSHSESNTRLKAIFVCLNIGLHHLRVVKQVQFNQKCSENMALGIIRKHHLYESIQLGVQEL